MSRLRALTLAAAIATTYSNLAFSHSGGPESAPLVTTLIDASGVVIYFSIATLVLMGT